MPPQFSQRLRKHLLPPLKHWSNKEPHGRMILFLSGKLSMYIYMLSRRYCKELTSDDLTRNLTTSIRGRRDDSSPSIGNTQLFTLSTAGGRAPLRLRYLEVEPWLGKRGKAASVEAPALHGLAALRGCKRVCVNGHSGVFENNHPQQGESIAAYSNESGHPFPAIPARLTESLTAWLPLSQLRAISRLLWPRSYLSRNTSRNFRTENLSFGMGAPLYRIQKKLNATCLSASLYPV